MSSYNHNHTRNHHLAASSLLVLLLLGLLSVLVSSQEEEHGGGSGADMHHAEAAATTAVQERGTQDAAANDMDGPAAPEEHIIDHVTTEPLWVRQRLSMEIIESFKEQHTLKRDAVLQYQDLPPGVETMVIGQCRAISLTTTMTSHDLIPKNVMAPSAVVYVNGEPRPPPPNHLFTSRSCPNLLLTYMPEQGLVQEAIWRDGHGGGPTHSLVRVSPDETIYAEYTSEDYDLNQLQLLDTGNDIMMVPEDMDEAELQHDGNKVSNPLVVSDASMVAREDELLSQENHD